MQFVHGLEDGNADCCIGLSFVQGKVPRLKIFQIGKHL